MVKYNVMESSDTVFYLGKREKSVSEETGSSEKNFRIAYGGDLPFALEKAEDKWNTKENMERVKILSQKCERRSMIVRRLIYLERRQMEIITAMAGHGKRYNEGGGDSFTLLIVMLFLISIPVWIILVVSGLNIWIASAAAVVLIFLAGMAVKLRRRPYENKQEELSYMLREIEEEHETLETEREKLCREIKELTDSI